MRYRHQGLRAHPIRKRLRAVLLSTFTYCSALSCGSLQPPPPPPIAPVGPKASPAARAPLESDASCKDLLTVVSALVAPQEDNLSINEISRILNVVHTAKQCSREGRLNRNDYEAVLKSVREAYERWYSHDPRSRAAVLSGETTTLTQRNSQMVPVHDGRHWSEHYLRCEDELLRLVRERTGENHPRELDSEFGWGSDASVLIRTDANIGMLFNLLEQPPNPEVDRTIEERLPLLAKALNDEATAWLKHPLTEPRDPEQQVRITDKGPVLKDREMTLRVLPTFITLTMRERFNRIAKSMKRLAHAWGRRPVGGLRSGLGEPLRSYIVTLLNNRRGPDFPAVPWAAHVEIESRPPPPGPAPRGSTPQASTTLLRPFDIFRKTELSRIHEEVLFDRLNIRALFEFRQAEASWNELLTPGADDVERVGLPPPTEAQRNAQETAFGKQAWLSRNIGINVAAEELLTASKHTESRDARLSGVSRLVLVADPLDGKQVVKRDDTAQLTPAERRDQEMRQYTSRVLGEISICLLNDALLEVPKTHECTYPLVTTPRPSWMTDCNAKPIRSAFVHRGQSIAPIPERTRDAYEKVIGALADNWDAVDKITGGPPVGTFATSPQTICELGFLFEAGTLGRLGVSIHTYNRIVELIARDNVMLEAPQAGPILGGAMQLVSRAMQSVCDTLKVTRCSAKIIFDAAQGQPQDKISPYKALLKEYCTAAQLGNVMASNAKKNPQRGGTSLIDRVSRDLGPITRYEYEGIAVKADKEARACGPLEDKLKRANAP